MMHASTGVNIAFLDVGHGDCAVAYDDDHSSVLVVDCGHGPTLLDFLSAEGIAQIDVALVTHNDEDHVSGMLQVVAEQRVRCLAIHPAMLGPGGRPRRVLSRLADEAERQNLPVVQVSPDSCGLLDRLARLSYGAEVLYPTPRQAMQASRSNTTSGILRLEWQGAAALITGDIDSDGWCRLLREPGSQAKVRADILKFPHHGGLLVDPDERPDSAPYAEALLNSIVPRATIISTGERRQWLHPHPDVIEALRSYGETREHRLLCTEVTSLCEPDCRARRSAVLSILPLCHHSARGRNGSGCPCAGTIRVRISGSGHIDVLPGDQHGRVMQLFTKRKCNQP